MAHVSTPTQLSARGLTSAIAIFLGTQLAAQGGGQPPNEVLRLETGFVTATLGDLDGDGISEIITGDMDYEPAGGALQNNGIVRVHSGATGAMLYSKEGANSWDNFGNAVANAGDTNRDGVDDFIVGAIGVSANGLANAGAAYLYSGIDGALIRVFYGRTAGGEYGFSVAGAGDTDNDNHDDVIIGDPFDTFFGGSVGAGYAEVRSGQDGSIQRFAIGSADDFVGYAVGYAGDLDNDGFADVYITSPGEDIGTGFNQGRFRVYSGRLWSELKNIPGPADNAYFGRSVATGADLDGDTHDDFLIGAPEAAPASMGFAQTGAAYAYSVTGGLIRTWTGEFAGDNFGRSVAIVQDLNGDGYGECLIGAPTASPNDIWVSGSAFLYSGIDGSLMHRWNGLDYFHELGNQVAACTDITGDGLSDFIICTEKNYQTSPSGRTSVWSWEPDPYLHASATRISNAAGGTVQFDLNFPKSEAGLTYILVGSATGTGPTVVNGVAIPLTADWLSTLMTGANPPAVFSNSQGQLDSNGDATALLNLPANFATSFLGVTFQFAAVSMAPPLVQLSSMAVPLTVDP
jgi:FG-GAP repeat